MIKIKFYAILRIIRHINKLLDKLYVLNDVTFCNNSTTISQTFCRVDILLIFSKYFRNNIRMPLKFLLLKTYMSGFEKQHYEFWVWVDDSAKFKIGRRVAVSNRTCPTVIVSVGETPLTAKHQGTLPVHHGTAGGVLPKRPRHM